MVRFCNFANAESHSNVTNSEQLVDTKRGGRQSAEHLIVFCWKAMTKQELDHVFFKIFFSRQKSPPV